MSDLAKALLLLGLLAVAFLGWRAVAQMRCRAACAEDCEAFAEATNPFGGRNALGLGLCEQGVRLCEDSCSFF
jgi:hypothetical protein